MGAAARRRQAQDHSAANAHDIAGIKIIAHQKAEVEAAGGVWVDPEERLRLEQEEADRIAEEAKLAELKAHCDKKGLNYETELAKLREKEAKKNKGKKD